MRDKKETKERMNHEHIIATPFRLLIIVTVSVFMGETLFMFLLPSLQIPFEIMIFIDALLLAILVFTLLYFFLLRPMNLYVFEQKRMWEELRVSKVYIDNILYSMTDTLIVINPDATIRTVNQATLDVLGYEEQELIGKSIRILLEEEEEEEEEEALFTGTGLAELVKKGAIHEIEITYLTKDASKIPMLFSGSVMRSAEGQLQGIVCVAQDITERKRMVTQLQENRAMYRALFEQAGDYAFILNPKDLTIIDTNETACEKHGYSRDELLGKSVLSLDANEEVKDRVPEMLEFLMSGESLRFETDHLRKDGSKFPVEVVSRLIHTSMNTSLILAVERDITERKQAEEKIRKTNDELVVVNKELKETQAQLIQSAKLVSLSEMATGIAHEINQPLTVMIGYAHLTLSDVKNGNYDEVETTLKLIIEQVQRAAKITNHLREFSRNSHLENKQAATVKQLIQNSFILIKKELELQNIELIEEVPDNLPLLDCHPFQLEQVLTNLILNAQEAMADSENKRLTVRSRQQDQWIVIEVADTGSGIPQHLQDRIFDPFFTTKEVGKGTGLGLSISYGIIKEHKGEINAFSAEGQGTIFTIKLPITAKER